MSLLAGSRLVLFAGGACTVGPGRVVGLSREEHIRVHTDIERGRPSAQLTGPAREFYEDVAERMLERGCCLDVFACSLDQIGLW